MYAAGVLNNGYRNKPSVICAIRKLAKASKSILAEWAMRVGVQNTLGSFLTLLGGQREVRRRRSLHADDINIGGWGTGRR